MKAVKCDWGASTNDITMNQTVILAQAPLEANEEDDEEEEENFPTRIKANQFKLIVNQQIKG